MRTDVQCLEPQEFREMTLSSYPVAEGVPADRIVVPIPDPLAIRQLISHKKDEIAVLRRLLKAAEDSIRFCRGDSLPRISN